MEMIAECPSKWNINSQVEDDASKAVGLDTPKSSRNVEDIKLKNTNVLFETNIDAINAACQPEEAIVLACEDKNQIDSASQNEKEIIPYKTTGLNADEVEANRKKFGPNEVQTATVPEWKKIIQRYFRIVPILLIAAAVLSGVVVEDGIRDWLSVILLIFLCNVMVWADYMGERSSSNAIAALKKLGAPECRAKRNNSWITLSVVELVPGDLVWLKAGVIIPADGVLVAKDAALIVDESALTGESIGVRKYYGSELLSGAAVQRGEGEMLVQKTGPESFYGKTLVLLLRAERKGHLRIVLDKTAWSLTLIAGAFAVFLLFWQSFHPTWEKLEKSHDNWVAILFKRAFILVASVVPAAMPVVTTTVLAVGALTMSKECAIVSRLSAIEEAAGVQILCSDKTGTLTLNELTINKEETVSWSTHNFNDLILYASLASSVTDPDAIDLVINENVNMDERNRYTVLGFTPFNPVDKRAESLIKSADGSVFSVTKGAPHVILEMVTKGSRNEAQMREQLHELIKEKATKGLRTLGVAIKDPKLVENSPWQLIGYICVYDPPRADTKETIQRASKLGINVKMLTGDQQAIAIETARILSLGQNIAGPDVFNNRPAELMSDVAFREYISEMDGFSGVYPEHKFIIVDSLQEGGRVVAMTGDGVNDAPALKRASIGIAVSGATDAAKSAADIILLAPGLSSIITVFSLSRQIFKRIEAYITFRLHSSLVTLFFLWGCVVIYEYQFPSWVLLLIAIINDFVLMSCSLDNVTSSNTPLVWCMTFIIILAVLTSIVGAICILTYIYLADPMYGINFFECFGLTKFVSDWIIPELGKEMSNQTNAGVWLLLSLILQMSFHTCRTQGFAFLYNEKNLAPNKIVVIPQIVAMILTLFLCVYWRDDWVIASGARVHGLSWGQAGVTLLWGVLWFFVIEAVKMIYTNYIWVKIYNSDMYQSHYQGNAPDKKELLFRHRVRAAFRTVENKRKERAEVAKREDQRRKHEWKKKKQDILERIRATKKKESKTTKLLSCKAMFKHKDNHKGINNALKNNINEEIFVYAITDDTIIQPDQPMGCDNCDNVSPSSDILSPRKCDDKNDNLSTETPNWADTQ